jgi:putative transposase
VFDETKYIRHITLKGNHNNNKMERLNGEIRDREKTMRGIKTKDTAILQGYQLFHNYFRPHEALDGKTPAEACGIKVEGQNKWKTLIQNASQN